MKYTLNVTLTDGEKQYLEQYLIKALAAQEYCTYLDAYTRNVLPKLVVYKGATPYLCQKYTYWAVMPPYIRIGEDAGYDQTVPMKERLMVLLALTGYLGERSVAMEAAIKKAVLKHLMGEYSEIKAQTIIEAGGIQQDGIALNEKDGQVAFLLADTWMLPSGETVNVETPEWEVYASKFPVVEVAEAAPATEAAEVADKIKENLVVEGF